MGLALPGTAYVAAGPNGVNATAYEQQFNASKIAGPGGWGGNGNPLAGIPVVGDIFGGLQFFYQDMQYLLDGFPKFLEYVKTSYIPDPQAQTAFEVIADALRAIYAFLITMFIIEFISGRFFTD